MTDSVNPPFHAKCASSVCHFPRPSRKATTSTSPTVWARAPTCPSSPHNEEYLAATGVITAKADQIYKYMNFNQIEEYVENAKAVA